jgi:endonuclease G
MNPRDAKSWGVLIAATLFLSASGKDPGEEPRTRPAVFSRYKQEVTLTAAQRQLVDRHCEFGRPLRAEAAPLGPTRLVVRDAYVLEHSSDLRFPLWVCEHLTRADVDQPTGRLDPEPFAPDPLLARFPRAELRDYRGSGFDRGHMAPDANREAEALKIETYFLSNMVPQAGQKFNRNIWLRLEEAVRDWAKKFGECWIITGGCIFDPKEESELTADGLVEYHTIGKGHVGVPTHLFKIVLRKEAGQPVALAIVMPNKSYEAGTRLEDFLVSIDSLEERTGFDFFPTLPAGDAAAIESQAAPELWERQ